MFLRGVSRGVLALVSILLALVPGPAAAAPAARPEAGTWRIVSMTGKITGTIAGVGCNPEDEPALPVVDAQGRIDPYFTEAADSEDEALEDLLEEHYLFFDPDDEERPFLFSLGFRQPGAMEPGYYTNEGPSAPLERLELPSEAECIEERRRSCGADPDCTETEERRADWERRCREWLGRARDAGADAMARLERLVGFAPADANLLLSVLSRGFERLSAALGRFVAGRLGDDGSFWGFEGYRQQLPGTRIGGFSLFFVRGTVTSPTTASGEWEYRGRADSGMCLTEDRGSGRFEAVWAGE